MYQRVTCDVKDIIALNQSKEYMLMASPIFEKVITDKRINSQASKLWQLLFNKSKFSAELAISISYSNLAFIFGKTTRTIGRWAKSLESCGYLKIQHNFDSSGGQLKSTLMVRLPQDVIQYAQLAKDRKSSQYKDTTINDSKIVEKENIKPEENIVKSLHTEDEAQCNLVEAPCDKNVQGRGDKSVLHLISVYKDIINNNSVVVSDDGKEEKKEKEENEKSHLVINSIESEITTLKNLIGEKSMILREINQLQSSDEKRTKQIETMESINQLDRNIHFLEDKKEKITKESENRKKKRKSDEFLRKNAESIKNVKGNRDISSFTFKRLMISLSELGYANPELCYLANEILYEVRFGSLTKGKDGKPLNVEKAINVGLKLVREKRWTTPSEMENFMADVFNHD